MKVLFIYPDYAITNVRQFQRGVALVSAGLKKKGIQTGLIHVHYKPERDTFLDEIRSFKPDIIAYSSITSQYPMIKHLAGWSKELNIYTIYGGIHPTMVPEESINTPGIDAICRGEGDEAIIDFVSTFSNKGDLLNVHGFWVKTDSVINKAPIRPLIKDLDSLPFPDYDLFPYDETDNFSVGGGYRSISVQASRGCPFKCTYCCNQYLKEFYLGDNKYVRWRSVKNVIAELKYLMDKYPESNFVRFDDDTLSFNKEWFCEFAEQYKKHINLPYSANDHIQNINEEVVRHYRDSRCISVKMGIENGNDKIRNQFMKRPFSGDEIINAFQVLREENIATGAFNIIGFCYETMNTILDTVKLNAKCCPEIIFKSYFQPFQGTEAYSMCSEMNLKIRDLKTSFFQEPAVELQTISQDQLIFGFRYFEILVRFYQFFYMLRRGEGSILVRMMDRILTNRLFPYKFFNMVIITRMDIKERFPRLGYILGRVKRLFVKPQF
jgi:radical SAM superfamily enzyme YgiQ (UPF0313 family)